MANDIVTLFSAREHCYVYSTDVIEGAMKRVNLLEYFELAEGLQQAERSTAAPSSKGAAIWIGIFGLEPKLRAFVADDNGFRACKHVAVELADAIDAWISHFMMDRASPPQLLSQAFEQEFHSYQYNHISEKVIAFKSVFAAECRDADVYSVEQVGIYKTSELVSNGSGAIPQPAHASIPADTLAEFNSAGKCLAFDLPTACGFHALRGVELMMDQYLRSFDVDTSELKSWFDYINRAKALIDNPAVQRKPSPKVAAMLDRMRELDRNPLMHPRDTLDTTQASMLFNLTAVTVAELARDMKPAIDTNVPMLGSLAAILTASPPAQPRRVEVQPVPASKTTTPA